MTTKKIIIITTILTISAVSGCFWYVQKAHDQRGNIATKNHGTQQQDVIINKESLLEKPNDSITKNDFAEDDGQVAEMDFGLFTLVYPKVWYWVTYDMPYDGFITNNKAITEPWTDPGILGGDDVRIIVSGAPMNSHFDLINKPLLQLTQVMVDDKKYIEQEYANATCEMIPNSDFDIMFVCRYSQGDVYHYRVDFGLIDSYEKGKPTKAIIESTSKNPALIEKFSIKRNY